MTTYETVRRDIRDLINSECERAATEMRARILDKVAGIAANVAMPRDAWIMEQLQRSELPTRIEFLREGSAGQWVGTIFEQTMRGADETKPLFRCHHDEFEGVAEKLCDWVCEHKPESDLAVAENR